MTETVHPAASGHLPIFITAPGETDVLFVVMVFFVTLMIFLIGILYLRLHALPEHMAHGASKTQLQVVAVLALIALFTHNHLFWIAALLLALIEFPDFSSPMTSIANSLRQMAGNAGMPAGAPSLELPETPAKSNSVSVEMGATPVEPDPAPAAGDLSERKE